MSRVGHRVDRLVASRVPDGGGMVVSGWEPGPAGVAVLDLLGGDAALVADVAEPDLLVSLQVPNLTSDVSHRLIETVLGADVIEVLRGVPGDGTPTVVWQRQDQIRRTAIGQGGLGLIGRLAIGLAEVTVAGRSDAAIAVGLVEAGIAAVLLEREISPSPSGLALVRAGVERWNGLSTFAFDGMPAPFIDRLATEARRWAATVETLDAGLATALERLAQALRGRHGPDVAATAAMGGAQPAAPASAAPAALRSASAKRMAAAEGAAPAADEMRSDAERSERARLPEVGVAVDGRLAVSSDVRIIGSELDGHHLTVHVGGLRDVGRSWLRVFADDLDGDGSVGARPTLLALAPFDGPGRPWSTAIALVPPEFARPERLLVDVTDEPSGPWKSAGSRSTQTAAALGAVAARASRRGGRDAVDRWRACGEGWDVVGDARRSALAAEYGASGSGHGGPGYGGRGLLADEL